MQYGEALQTIGGLSRTDKMPWYSWSISAHDCITGGKLQEVEGSTCASCYALTGHYNFPNVKSAHSRRKLAFDDPRFVDAFVIVLQQLRARQRVPENRFRWFDSGDLQSVEMLVAINEIALRTPDIHHWLPTRELRIIREYRNKFGKFAANLVVRVSAPMVGQRTSNTTCGLPVSTVGVQQGEALHQCVAKSVQGNKCLDCRACWETGDVNYPLH